ncbi:MAG: hypothetical protein ACR2H2_11795, partial [Solirubrobacteraceae bacterium]
ERPADQVLGEADIVFGKARVILEAMACGRAAYVFDHNGADGWVTAATYDALAPDNFGGQSLREVIDEERLVADLGRYDRGMGLVNRDLVVANHAASGHAAAVVEVLGRVAGTPRGAPDGAPLRELARLVRMYHRADAQAFALRAECESLAARTQAAEQRADDFAERAQRTDDLEERMQRAASFEGELAAAQGELAAARRSLAAQAGELARVGGLLCDVTGSRRWRVLQALLSPADRARRKGPAVR